MLSLHLSFCDCNLSLLLLLGLGAVTGLLGGFFGVGGGWIITPALNIFGMPMPYAVGTGLCYITGMTLVSAAKHRKRGNLDGRLGLCIGISMMIGVQFGRRLMARLEGMGSADQVTRTLYIVFLLGLGVFMLAESIRARAARKSQDKEGANPNALLLRLRWRPFLALRCGLSISVWPVAAVGLFAGFLSGILGVGGGFLLMPIMAYLMGVPTVVAVGTSLLCLLLASPFGVLAYSGITSFVAQHLSEGGLPGLLSTSWPELRQWIAAHGRVEYLAALVMVGGACAGAPVGVHASHLVHGRSLRLLYAIMILLGGLSVLLMQLHQHAAARAVILGAAGGMAFLILVLLGVATTRLREADAAENQVP